MAVPVREVLALPAARAVVAVAAATLLWNAAVVAPSDHRVTSSLVDTAPDYGAYAIDRDRTVGLRVVSGHASHVFDHLGLDQAVHLARVHASSHHMRLTAARQRDGGCVEFDASIAAGGVTNVTMCPTADGGTSWSAHHHPDPR